MEPEQLVQKTVEAGTETINISLKHGDLRYDAAEVAKRTLERPVKIDSTFDWESVYGLYTKGIEKSRQRLYQESRTWLEKCIGRDPSYMPALTALADLDLRAMNYDDAELKLRRVLSFDTYDPEANFLYGNVLSLKGEYYKARDAYGASLKSIEFRPAALNRLAIIALKQGRYNEAEEYINDALLFNGTDKNILMTAAAISRVRKNSQEYNAILRKFSDADPLSHFVAFEKYLSESDSSALMNFKHGINTEFKNEVYIGLATWYLDAGLVSDAIKVMKTAPAEPLDDYLTAYLCNLTGDKSACSFYLNRALKADIKLVFPYRDEYATILKWASSVSPGWKNDYYLALLWWSRGKNENAATLFRRCADIPENPAFYLSRANFHRQAGSSPDARKDYLKALQYSVHDWRPYHLFYDFLVSEKDCAKADSISKAALRTFPDSYIIRTDRAMALIKAGDYKECIDLLSSTEILPYEGAGYGHTIWRQANLLEAIRFINNGKIKAAKVNISKARLWPENLGTGKPFNVNETEEDILDAICAAKEGDRNGFDKLRKLVPSLGPRLTGAVFTRDPESLINERLWVLITASGI